MTYQGQACEICGDEDVDLEACALCGREFCDGCGGWCHEEHDLDCGDCFCVDCGGIPE